MRVEISMIVRSFLLKLQTLMILNCNFVDDCNPTAESRFKSKENIFDH